MASQEPTPNLLDTPQKVCQKCGETKPETAFYLKHASRYPGLRSTVCKQCESSRQKSARVEHRAEINARRQERRAHNRDERNAQARAWLAANAERVNARRRARRAANPAHERQQARAKRAANPEHYRAQDRAHYAKTSDVHRARERERYHANVTRMREEQRHKRKEYPERFRQYEQTRRLKHRDAMRERRRRRYAMHGSRWNAIRRARYAEHRLENAARIRAYNRRWRTMHSDQCAITAQRKEAMRRARMLNRPAAFTREDRQVCYQYFGYACAFCGREAGFDWTLALDHFIPLAAPDSPGSVPWNMVPACHGIHGCNNSKGPRDPHAWLEARFGKRKAREILRKITTYFALMRDQHGIPSPPEQGAELL